MKMIQGENSEQKIDSRRRTNIFISLLLKKVEELKMKSMANVRQRTRKRERGIDLAPLTFKCSFSLRVVE